MGRLLLLPASPASIRFHLPAILTCLTNYVQECSEAFGSQSSSEHPTCTPPNLGRSCLRTGALSEAGLRVPQDVSVVGFDDIPLAEFLWPPLTTVQQDFHLIGRQLMDLLLRQIRDREVLADHRIVVPTRLIGRGSAAAPRALES